MQSSGKYSNELTSFRCEQLSLLYRISKTSFSSEDSALGI